MKRHTNQTRETKCKYLKLTANDLIRWYNHFIAMVLLFNFRTLRFIYSILTSIYYYVKYYINMTNLSISLFIFNYIKNPISNKIMK